MNTKKLILVAATSALVCAAMAQGGGQRRGGFGQMGDPVQLLGREDVQKDLVLTDDEKAKIVDLGEKARQKRQESMQALFSNGGGGDPQERFKAMQPIMDKLNAENMTAIAGILTPDQVKRLKEITVQMVGVSIVTTNKDVQKDLEISDDQKTKFADLRQKQMTAMQELFQNSQGDRQAITDGMAKNQKIMDVEINKVLTDAQKAKLKDMAGKPFTRVDPPPPGGGR